MAKVMLTRPLRKHDEANAYVKKKEIKVAGVRGGGVSPLKGDNHPPNHPVPRVEEKSGKTSVDLDAILADAATLSPALRKELLARLSLDTNLGGQERDQDMWSQAIYDGLVQALGNELGAVVGPALVKRAITVPAVWSPVREFMVVSKLDTLKVTERQACYRLLAKLVIEKAKYVARQGRAPLSAKLVGNVAANVAAIFDQSFPGYVASGLAPMIARQLCAAR